MLLRLTVPPSFMFWKIIIGWMSVTEAACAGRAVAVFPRAIANAIIPHWPIQFGKFAAPMLFKRIFVFPQASAMSDFRA
jgi:hypothetical protein